MKSNHLRCLIWGGILAGCGSPAGHAADLYWDANGITDGTGGTGDWYASSTWRSGSETGTVGDWATSSNVFLAGTAGVITLAGGSDSDVVAASMTVSTNGYTIKTTAASRELKTSGTISLASNVTLTLEKSGTGNARFEAGAVNSGGGTSLVLSSQVSGTNAFELAITGASGGVNTPVSILGSGGGLIGILSDATGVTVSGGISNSSSSTTVLKANDNKTLTLQSVGISGSSGTAFGVNGTGAGIIDLNVASSYGGSTTVNTASSGLVRLGLNNALPTSTSLTVTQGTLDLQGHSQTVHSLAGTGGSVKGSTGAILKLNGSASTTFEGKLTGAMGFEQAGSATLTLSGINDNTGKTTVSQGTLKLTGNGSIAASSGIEIAAGAVFDGSTVTGGWTLASGQNLSGSGTVTGGVTVNGTHAPVGAQSVTGDLTYASGSIFEWSLGTASTSSGFDTVSVGGALGTALGAFRVISDLVIDGVAADGFWSSQRVWNTVFGVTGSKSGWAANTAVAIYGTNQISRDVSSYGAFSISGTTLTWTPVPEPSSALAGLLLGAGLLRRRRQPGRA